MDISAPELRRAIRYALSMLDEFSQEDIKRQHYETLVEAQSNEDWVIRQSAGKAKR